LTYLKLDLVEYTRSKSSLTDQLRGTKLVRVVANRFHQQYSMNYEELFSYVAKMITIRTLIVNMFASGIFITWMSKISF